jgi:molybdopterin-biosynthesis enzyme MoeA-like protein
MGEDDRRRDERGARETVRADLREGDIGMQLGEIAKANPEVAIGSYPFFDQQHGPNTNVVLRARDAQKLAQAKRAVEDMLERVRPSTIK